MMVHAVRMVAHIVLLVLVVAVLVHLGGIRGGVRVVVVASMNTPAGSCSSISVGECWMSDGIKGRMRWTHPLCHEPTSIQLTNN